MTENKRDKLKKFRKLVNSVIKKRTSNKSEYDREKDKYQSAISDLGSELYGRMFYLVLKDLGENIDDICNRLFKDHQWNHIADINRDHTKLAQFISLYTNSEMKVASAAGIEKGRFNRIKNDRKEDLYAWDVYGLAKAFRLQPSQLFEYFYGDGQRPVVGYKTQ